MVKRTNACPPKSVVIVTRVIGYLVCLAFVTLALTLLGPFFGMIENSEANVGRIIDSYRFDPAIGPWTTYTVEVFGTAFSPVIALGHLAAVVASPVGLLALLLYFLISWMMPAR